MSKKLFFVSMLFAAVMFSFTSCGDKLDPNDPNPHCFKVTGSYDDGSGTNVPYLDYVWMTDAEFQDDYLPGIMVDGIIPVWTKVNAENEDACYALGEEDNGDEWDDTRARCWKVHWPRLDAETPAHWHYLWMTEKEFHDLWIENDVEPLEFSEASEFNDGEGTECDEMNLKIDPETGEIINNGTNIN